MYILPFALNFMINANNLDIETIAKENGLQIEKNNIIYIFVKNGAHYKNVIQLNEFLRHVMKDSYKELIIEFMENNKNQDNEMKKALEYIKNFYKYNEFPEKHPINIKLSLVKQSKIKNKVNKIGGFFVRAQ